MNNRSIKSELYEIIFKADTHKGKNFDLILILSIIASVLVVFLDSVEYYNKTYGGVLYTLEWFFKYLYTPKGKELKFKRTRKKKGNVERDEHNE